jgi:tRNA (guanine-N7-)-methyltransferase
MPRNNPYAEVPVAPPELDLAALGAGRDVEIDVGFGRGHFILDRAVARPEALLLGLEMRRKWVGTVAAKARRLGLANVELFYGDVRSVLDGWGPDGAVAAVHVHFPDPWWKKRHHKRRVLTAETVRRFAHLLRDGGVLFVQTDVEDLARLAHGLLTAEPALALRHGRPDAPSDHNPIGTMSHRERKCVEAGLPVYRFLLERVSRPAPGAS